MISGISRFKTQLPYYCLLKGSAGWGKLQIFSQQKQETVSNSV